MTNSNKSVVPEAKEALNKFKYEVANEVGVNLKQGYNGDLSSKDANNSSFLSMIFQLLSIKKLHEKKHGFSRAKSFMCIFGVILFF